MTEKRFCVQERCVVDNTDNETFEFSFQVDAEIICEKLNEIADENEQLKKENKHLRCTIESNSQDDYINYLKKQNEQLKQELFEARKDYLIETADISDKLYLEDEIEEERKEIINEYGTCKEFEFE